MKILYFSSVPFSWMKQRPQFVAEFLSQKHKTDYVCCIPFGKKKDRDNSNAPLKTANIFVLPFALKSAILRFFNKLWLNLKIKFNKYDLIILTHPIQYAYIPKNIPFIYDCMDQMSGFYQGLAAKTVTAMEQALVKKASRVIVSSDKLKEHLISQGANPEKITVIKNAVDKTWVYGKTEKLPLKHPNLVYIGTVSNWFDIKTIVDFCEKRPEKTVYIVGKCDFEVKNIPNNLVFTGKVSHEDVRNYIKSADIMLLPFKITNLIECVDPVKLYEYLSYNKHVIATYWDELSQYKTNPYVHFYDTSEEFISLTDMILDNSDTLNEEFIAEHCWEQRMEKYFKVINNSTKHL